MSTSAEVLARILDGVPHPVWVVRRDGTTLCANPAAVAALGYDAAEPGGLPSHRTVHVTRADGSACPEDECPMCLPSVTGEPGSGTEAWFVRRDGSLFPVSWSSAPIEWAGGAGAVVAFADVTGRREAERAVHESADGSADDAPETRRRAADHEVVVRQNIARDLHDGAQQRLVVLLVALQLAREELGPPPTRATALLDEAHDQAKLAIDELRELAAGVHPSILTTRGLPPAVEGLAARSALPVTVVSRLEGRPPAAIEAQAYYFVVDALTLAVEHASATHIAITIGSTDTMLVVEVSDDGPGGAHREGDRAGLAGLAARVDALDGTFTVTSRAGTGTVVRAELPTSGSSSSRPPGHVE